MDVAQALLKVFQEWDVEYVWKSERKARFLLQIAEPELGKVVLELVEELIAQAWKGCNSLMQCDEFVRLRELLQVPASPRSSSPPLSKPFLAELHGEARFYTAENELRGANMKGILKFVLRNGNIDLASLKMALTTLFCWTQPEALFSAISVEGNGLLQVWAEMYPEDFSDTMRNQSAIFGMESALICHDELAKDHWKKALVTWLLVSRQLGLVKDVAKLIAKMTHPHEWIRNARLRQVRLQCIERFPRARFDAAAFLLRFKAFDIAKLVCSKSAELFCSINPRKDFARQFFPNGTVTAPSILRITRFWCDVSNRLVSILLWSPSLLPRIFELLAEVTSLLLLHFRDYFLGSCFAFAISKYGLFEVFASPEAKKVYGAAFEIIAPKMGYIKLRDEMSRGSCVPSFSVLLADLTFLYEGQRSNIEEGIVNFGILYKVQRIMDTAISMQVDCKKRIMFDCEEFFEGGAALDCLLSSLPFMNDAEMERISKEIKDKCH